MDDPTATMLEDASGRIALAEAPAFPAAAAVAVAAAASRYSTSHHHQQQQSPKTRLAELSFLKSTLQHEAWFLPEDWEESVLGQILGGLRCEISSQVCLQALECLLALVPQLNYYELTPFTKELASTVGDVLGDSRPSVRERAQEVLSLFVSKVGGRVVAVLEGLRPALTHRNPRLRKEVAKFLSGRLLVLVPGVMDGEGEGGEGRQLLLEALVALAADANSEVRGMAMEGLEQVLRREGRGGLGVGEDGLEGAVGEAVAAGVEWRRRRRRRRVC